MHPQMVRENEYPPSLNQNICASFKGAPIRKKGDREARGAHAPFASHIVWDTLLQWCFSALYIPKFFATLGLQKLYWRLFLTTIA